MRKYLIELKSLKDEKEHIWKERHKELEKKYDNSERGRELSELRSKKLCKKESFS